MIIGRKAKCYIIIIIILVLLRTNKTNIKILILKCIIILLPEVEPETNRLLPYGERTR